MMLVQKDGQSSNTCQVVCEGHVTIMISRLLVADASLLQRNEKKNISKSSFETDVCRVPCYILVQFQTRKSCTGTNPNCSSLQWRFVLPFNVVEQHRRISNISAPSIDYYFITPNYYFATQAPVIMTRSSTKRGSCASEKLAIDLFRSMSRYSNGYYQSREHSRTILRLFYEFLRQMAQTLRHF